MDTSIPLIGQAPAPTTVPKLILPGQEGPGVPLNKHGMPKFLKKEKVENINPIVESKRRLVIPPVYYWEDVNSVTGTSSLMTMAFRWHDQNWGECFEIPANSTVEAISVLRKKLFGKVKKTLDVLLHHGEAVIDRGGNIHPALVEDQEALRWKHDKYWKHKVAAFEKLVRIAPITRKKAVKLKLLDA